MPRRTDISSVLVVGSGPIVIGQACEFDYSGTQACRALRDLGYRVILVNSNPATIMTDPDFADATYLEPLTPYFVEQVIAKEKPDCLLPTMGGQTALNLTKTLAETGVLARYGVELIGASLDAILTAEDRQLFKQAMTDIGLDLPCSGSAETVTEALALGEDLGYPVIVRPAFTLGGGGSGLAASPEALALVAGDGIRQSPVSQVLIEESIVGWKEFELEVMRDLNDNVVVICSIENVDPMGVHTGDSITVAPAQTLTDQEYQVLRDAALACIRRIGVETGGSNIQFAVHPETGRVVVIEMNPRVSRSSALASKATGFPIAKVAAQLAVGLTLDEIPNDITKQTPAAFEPVIDYVVTKVPRWAFEKFPDASSELGTTMRSVGEVMAIGRTFPESLQKALRSLEEGHLGLGCGPKEKQWEDWSTSELLQATARPAPDRILLIAGALRAGVSVEEVALVTGVDLWFLRGMAQIVAARAALEGLSLETIGKEAFRDAKRLGFSDAQLAYLWETDASSVRDVRQRLDVYPTFKTVDTCAAEFAASTPYYYSTYEDECEVRAADRPQVMILGSGPNRIGQGIEFDYCCVHAVYALEEAGYETVMLNCNPETVSTDYDTASQLFFEPLTIEDVCNVVDVLGPEGVLLQLGGQTPLKLAKALEVAGVPIAGTSPSAIDDAEDRERFHVVCTELGIVQPPGGTAENVEDACKVAASVGYPVLVRPSYVLGGRSMEIVYDEASLRVVADRIGREGGFDEGPLLIDRFLEDAVEVDVDACFDGETFLLGGILEHIEEAGVHSGDSACVIPPPSLPRKVQETLVSWTELLARHLDVCGLINVQYAVRDEQAFVIEANPRASRTVPFIAKSVNLPLAKIAARVMMGERLVDLEAAGYFTRPDYDSLSRVHVKEAVLPFLKFPESDALLGPEMRSTGEVMGIDRSFGAAFSKSQLASGSVVSESGRVFFSVASRDKKQEILNVACSFAEAGFHLVATPGTARFLRDGGLTIAEEVRKVTGAVAQSAAASLTVQGTVQGEQKEGRTILDMIPDGEIVLIVNTPRGRGSRADGAHLRSAAVESGIPIITTVAGAKAAAAAMTAARDDEQSPYEVRSLQEWYALGELEATPCGGAASFVANRGENL